MKRVEAEIAGGFEVDLKKMLTLKEDKTIGWTTDARWEDMMRLAKILPGEDELN